MAELSEDSSLFGKNQGKRNAGGKSDCEPLRMRANNCGMSHHFSAIRKHNANVLLICVRQTIMKAHARPALGKVEDTEFQIAPDKHRVLRSWVMDAVVLSGLSHKADCYRAKN